MGPAAYRIAAGGRMAASRGPPLRHGRVTGVQAAAVQAACVRGYWMRRVTAAVTHVQLQVTAYRYRIPTKP